MHDTPIIDPMTTGELRVTVTNLAGAPVTTATVVATVSGPQGTVATNAAFTHEGAGVYVLTVEPAWSTNNTDGPVQGLFKAIVTATVPASPSDIVHTALFEWRCKFATC